MFIQRRELPFWPILYSYSVMTKIILFRTHTTTLETWKMRTSEIDSMIAAITTSAPLFSTIFVQFYLVKRYVEARQTAAVGSKELIFEI